MVDITTNYNAWLLHLHVGKRCEPLTIYPTDAKDIVTVMYGKQKWETISRKEAEAILGRIVLFHKGNVKL